MTNEIPSSDRRASRRDWLEKGLALLRDQGDGALTVEALCEEMGKTKGSFYHHFAGRDDFVEKLLEHWEETFTGRVIEDLEPVEDPASRLRELGRTTARKVDLRLERTLRVWSDREPLVRRVVERVDAAREAYLFRLFSEAIGDPARARLAARAHMAMLVGTEMLYQELSREELRSLNAFIDHLGFVDTPRFTDAPNDPSPTEARSTGPSAAATGS